MHRRQAQRGSREGERGYILALLLGICTVMGIYIQKAIPAAYAEVQRENEAELIYRGEHLAKGIRAFNLKLRAYPTNLDMLLKQRPRLIRKVYKDPMTPEGDWVFVYPVQTGKGVNTEGLPIVGVHSKSQKDSFRKYRGKTIYSDWVFSAADNLLGVPGGDNLPQGPTGGRPGAPGGDGRPGNPGDPQPAPPKP